MALLVLLPFTGLLARSGMPGYSLWLLLHLVAGHVILWCAPHCRYLAAALMVSIKVPKGVNANHM